MDLHLKKISLVILLLISTLFIGCGDSSTVSILSSTQVYETELDENKTMLYQQYSEKTLSKRAEAFKLYEEVKDVETLSGANLNDLHLMLVDYLQNREKTQFYIDEYSYLLHFNSNYTPQEHLELIMISLSTMLMRYDDYLLVYAKYNDDIKLRTLLNSEDSAYDIPEYTLESIVELYLSDEERDLVEELILYYDDHIEYYGDENDPFFLYLKQLIDDSASYQLGFSFADEVSSNFDDILNSIIDTTSDLFSFLFSGVSESIGNTAGLIEEREGKLYNDPAVTENVRVTLQAGDLLLEKTPFRLTDKLIPGYYGHIAVYVGTQEELEALGIWDDPIVQEYKDQIINAQVIAEALRDGVQLNSVEHFLNVDDLAIMHNPTEDLEEKKARILLTFRQLGKEYDFEYDVENNDKIICSELVYVTYISIDWETEYLAGVETISPDNVAIKALEEGTVFTIPLLYHDGEEIFDDHREYMQGLLDSVDE